MILYADNDDIDADRVWKDSSVSGDSKQQPAGATSEEASLLKGIQRNSSFSYPQLADILQAPTPPLDL